MRNTNPLFYAVFVFVFFTLSTPIYAQSNKVHTAVSVGIAHKDLEITDRQQRPANARFSALTVSFNAAMNNYFVSAATELPMGVDNVTQTPAGAEWVQSEQHSLTLGYNPAHSLSVFAGLVYSRYILRNGKVENIDKGPFLGAGYSLDVGEANSLNFSVAYGALDGAILILESPSNNAKGDTSGYSYGLTYTGIYNDDLDYFIRLKVSDYDFEQDTTPLPPRTRFSSRKFTTLSVGLTF